MPSMLIQKATMFKNDFIQAVRSGTLKINVDASMQGLNVAATVGMVVRDHIGAVLSSKIYSWN